MAKVRTAKQRITEFLKAKGLDAAEIKDAFDELDAADMDLDKVAAQLQDAVGKNAQWQEWYAGAAPEIGAVVAERDQLKAALAKLQEAGIQVDLKGSLSNSAQRTAEKLDEGKSVTPAQLEELRNDIARRTSDVMKQLTRVSIRHLKEFDEELDLDGIEKLVTEKGYSVEDAYSFAVAPKREERSKKQMDELVAQRVKEGIQAELSKQGIRNVRKRTDDVEPAPLDKPAPSDSELRAAFSKDLDAEVTH